MSKGKDDKRRNHARHGRKASRQMAKRGKKSMYIDSSDPLFRSFAAELELLGLRLHDVPGDGALADQLDNGVTSHEALRSIIVQYIKQHEKDFSPFVEEGISFDKYISELSKDGVYGGNDVIVAFARHHAMDIVIHQPGTPQWEVRVPSARRVAHVAYMNGEHYCSVRPLTGRNSAELPASHAACEFLASSLKQQEISGNWCNGNKERKKEEPVVRQDGNLERLMEVTLCQNIQLAQQCLEENAYDLDSAIIELFQLMELKTTEVDAKDVIEEAEGRLSEGRSMPSAEFPPSLDQSQPLATGMHSVSQKHSTPRAMLRREAKAERKKRRVQEQRQKSSPTKAASKGLWRQF